MLDANELERMARERPDECFLKGSGVAKLIGAVRQLEADLRTLCSPVITDVDAWEEAERITDVPAVAEAIGNLLEDQTGTNATCLVRAVLEAARGMGGSDGN